MGDKEAAAKVDLGLLEEDDEFEEFPTDDAATKAGLDTRVNVWEDNWDDDTKEDDFAEKLRGMEGGRGVTRRRGEEATPPPAKKRCTVSTPPAPAPTNGHTNGSNGATNGDLEELPASTRRSSRTSASSRGSQGGSPPSSPARRGRRAPEQSAPSPARSSGRRRQPISS